MPIVLEVCVDSVRSAIAAVDGGANRLELCANLGLGGGTTPSAGLFKAVRKAVPGLPIMTMIRPRTGDFVYEEDEVEVMLEDIQLFASLGADGFVFGLLEPDGAVDVGNTTRLVQAAQGREICFHRAFDMIPLEKSETALAAISSIPGISRILTSGQEKAVPAALLRLGEYIDQAATFARPITILPGSGINSTTVRGVLDALVPKGLQQVHMSGGRWHPGPMLYRKEGMGMGVGGDGEWGIWCTDVEEVRRVRRLLDSYEA